MHEFPLQPRPEASPLEAAQEGKLLRKYAVRHASAHHRSKYVQQQLRVWRRFRDFTGRPFWLWTRADLEAYSAWRSKQVNGPTLGREQGAIGRILAFGRDPAYPFDEEIYALTGRRIPQICTADNTVHHRTLANTSKRRQYTPAELDRLFLAIREQIRARLRRGRKAALPACMHFAILCFSLAFGLREFEVVMADLADLHPALSPEMRAFSAFEDVVVRFGKSYNGGGYKRRTVAAIAVFRRYLAAVEWYLREIRPQLVRAESPEAIFLTQRGQRMRADSLSHVVARYNRQAHLSSDLTHHCLRHTFETLLHESGLDLTTIKDLMGHEHEATTQIYDHLSPERIRQRCLALNRRVIAESARRAALPQAPA